MLTKKTDNEVFVTRKVKELLRRKSLLSPMRKEKAKPKRQLNLKEQINEERKGLKKERLE